MLFERQGRRWLTDEVRTLDDSAVSGVRRHCSEHVYCVCCVLCVRVRQTGCAVCTRVLL